MSTNLLLFLQLLSVPDHQNRLIDTLIDSNQAPKMPTIKMDDRDFYRKIDTDLENGCDLNIFEEDACANYWKNGDHQKIDKSIIRKRNVIRCPKWLWPDRTIPFKMELRSQSIIDLFRKAIDELNQLGCVQFRPLSIDQEEIDTLIKNREKYLTVREIEPQLGRSCQASLGSTARRPRLDLSRVCSKGQVLHELMHVLGFAHEHQRPDRDLYVKVRCQHMLPNVSQDFRKLRSRVIAPFIDEEPYDFRSIMHYRLDHFSIDGRMTLEPLDTEALIRDEIRLEDIGKMTTLSQGDVRKLMTLYQC